MPEAELSSDLMNRSLNSPISALNAQKASDSAANVTQTQFAALLGALASPSITFAAPAPAGLLSAAS